MSDTWISFNGNALSLNGYGLVVRGQNPYNPLNLPNATIRFQFSDLSYDPTQVSGWKTGTAWTQVSTTPNIWDCYYDSSTYTNAFTAKFIDNANLVSILGANLNDVTTMSYCFEGCSSLSSIGYMYTPSVGTFNSAFHNCTKLQSVDGILTSSASDLQSMYNNCSALLAIPSDMDTSAAISMTRAFASCSSLRSIPLLNTGNVLNLSGLFDGCYQLSSIPALDTSNATNLSSYAKGCSSLVSVPTMDCGNCTNFNSMFSGCTSLETAPVLGSTRKGVNFNNMFYRCSNMGSIPSLITDNAADVGGMFKECYKVSSGSLALYTQMSSQAFPPSSHGDCFKYCGRDTTTGAAELAQIPTSWGGTMA